MKKPVIGVMPLWDENKDSLWMLPGYLDGIREAGAVPMIFPFLDAEEEIRQLCDLCDGFLFTGGHDVDPSVYGEEPMEGKIGAYPPRDVMERVVLSYALENDLAVLGICRGIQFINAAMGGTLYQDLPTQHPSETAHVMTRPYNKEVHRVKIIAGSPLEELFEGSSAVVADDSATAENSAELLLPVNSYHHQAVKVLAPGLEVMAESVDGLVEAVYAPGYNFVWAVQWHPEFYQPREEMRSLLFGKFVENCR